MKHLILSCFVAIFLLSITFSANSSVKQDVVIALNDWSSQRVLSYVTKYLFEQHQAKVVFREVNIDDQWGGLKSGRIDVQIEVWQGTMAETFNQLTEQGFIIDAGTHSAVSREEWWYPYFVEQLCPGLPDWKALKGCSHLFAEHQGKATFYSGLWGHHDGPRIRALDLNEHYQLRRIEDDLALWRLLAERYFQKQPIIMFNWTPNWTDVRLVGKFVEFPEYDPACETDPHWGINPHMIMDCGSPKNGWIKKTSSIAFKQNNPCLFAILKEINFSTEMIAEASALVVIDKLNELLATEKWLDKYQTQWQQWLINAKACH